MTGCSRNKGSEVERARLPTPNITTGSATAISISAAMIFRYFHDEGHAPDTKMDDLSSCAITPRAGPSARWPHNSSILRIRVKPKTKS